MKNKKRLWLIFGPVICAVILLGIVFSIPWERTFSYDSIYQAAASQTTTVFKGQALREAAYKEDYVPFYGSSELSRFDNMHPTVLATKYHRNYMPFLLGGAGSQSLAQFIGMQNTSSKKAVVIISPQWFTKDGQDPAAFGLYYSPLHTIDFILGAKDTLSDRYAARRLLKMPVVKDSDMLNDALLKIAAGQDLSKTERFTLIWRRRMLANEDTFFTSLQLRDRLPKIEAQAKGLPKKYSYSALKKVSEKQAKKQTSSNDFNIRNSFYEKRLNSKILKKLEGSQKDYDYVKSQEFSDFELMLKQLAKNKTQVLFVIPPVNKKWQEFTGLSQKMYEKSVAKIKYQLVDQGFNYIYDLSNDGGKKYFMEDTIHLGWNGWLEMDRAVKPFMEMKYTEPKYRLDNYYYDGIWRNETQAPPVSITNKQVLKELRK